MVRYGGSEPPLFKVVGETGIEPVYEAYEATELPVLYSPINVIQ